MPSDIASPYGLTTKIRFLAGLLLFSLALTLALLYWSAKSQDKIALESSHHLAKTALAVQHSNLGKLVTDYTFWDDAYQKSVEAFDPEWFDEYFGDSLYLMETFGVTSSFIMGPDGRILRLMLNSEIVGDSRAQDFAKQVEGGLDTLIDEARRRVNGEFNLASGMVLIDGQLNFIAVRAIHPHTEAMLANFAATSANIHVAAFMRPLDDELLESLGSAFDLANLRYGPAVASSDTPTQPIYGANGRYFGSLTWDIDLPSRHVLYGVLPALLAAIFSVGLLGWCLLNSLRRGQMELWQAMVRAQSADRTKTEFLANMSHELRTPLNAIIGFSEVMRNKTFGPLGDKRYVDYNNNIHNSGVQLLDLIDDVLELSKVEAGTYALQETEIALWELTATVCRLVEPKIAEKEIVFDVMIGPTLPALYADERALKQILLNLLSNAIKFTPDQGRVGLELIHDSDGALRLTVSDTGVGIPKDQVSLVMEPFHQVAGPMTASEGGTGLGLPLTASLAALHGAAIRIESEVGQGTSVIVEFPPERVVFPSAA